MAVTKSPANLLADLLVGASTPLGSYTPTDPWRITIGSQRDTPDSQITLYDAGGTPGLPTVRLDYPSVQVRVRGTRDDYPGAFAKVNDIVEFFNGIQPQDVAGDHISGIILGTGIIPIGDDEKSRPQFTVTFNCFLERGADSSTYMHRESL